MFDLTTMTLLTQLLLLASLSSLGYGFLFGCKCGKVEPPDPYVFFNDTIVMNCTLNSVTETLNSSDLYFIKYDSNNIGKKIPSEIIDEKTIMLTKIARPGDEGNYYCEKPSLDPYQSIVGGQVVKLEYKPPKLKNEDMTCILYNWGEKMECSWELPFLSMFYINVTLEWFNGGSGNCPTMSKNKTMCIWDRKKDGVSLDVGDWFFRLIIMNTKTNVSTESIIRKYMLNLVKPNKVIEFSISFTNDSNCVVLSWEYDRSYSHRLQFARIRYVSKRSSVVSILHTKNNHDNITICSLFPYMEYNFTIDVKPAEGGYWSDPEVKAFTTDEDVPLAAPEMRPGYYEHSSDGCKMENDQHSTRIFWKRIPKDERNGVITGYKIIIRNLDTNFVNNTHVSGEQDISKSLMLNCSNKYNVTIKARTKKGVSPYGSSILIPNGYNTDLIPPKVIVEVEDKDQELLNVFNVTWTLPAKVARNTIRGFTVHYCPGGSSGTCQEELQSVNVSAEKRWLLLHNLDGFYNYLIGVSMESAKLSSGLFFTSCVYKKNQVPPVPSNVEVHTQMDNALTVTWGPTNCNGDNPYVIKYTVYSCKISNQDCEEPMKIHEVLSSESLSYDLTNLEKGQKYGVQVAAHSYYQTSQRSEMIIQVPKNSDLDAGQITGISFAVIFVLVLCIAGLVFCIRICREKYKTFNKELKIDIPDVDVLLYIRDVHITLASYQKICPKDGLDHRPQGSFESSSDGSDRKNLMSTIKWESKSPYRQNSDESGIGSMNEDDHQRSSPPSSSSHQSSKHMPVVNEENFATDDQNGYQSFDDPPDQSHDQSKDSSKKDKNSLICIPTEGYSKITSPDNDSNSENSETSARLYEQPSTDDTPDNNTTHRISPPSEQEHLVMHAASRPKNFFNTGNGPMQSLNDTRQGINSGTQGSFSACTRPLDTASGTLSDYVRETRAALSADITNARFSDHLREMRTTCQPNTSSGTPDYVGETGATMPLDTSSATLSDYVRETRTGDQLFTSSSMPSDYISKANATLPPDTSSGAPSNYVKETRAGEPSTATNYVSEADATLPPMTSNSTPSDCVIDTEAALPPNTPSGTPSDYVSALTATLPLNTSSGTPSDYVSTLTATLPPNTSSGTPSDYVSTLIATMPPNTSSGTSSDNMIETRDGQPPTMSNGMPSDYIKM